MFFLLKLFAKLVADCLSCFDNLLFSICSCNSFYCLQYFLSFFSQSQLQFVVQQLTFNNFLVFSCNSFYCLQYFLSFFLQSQLQFVVQQLMVNNFLVFSCNCFNYLMFFFVFQHFSSFFSNIFYCIFLWLGCLSIFHFLHFLVQRSLFTILY